MIIDSGSIYQAQKDISIKLSLSFATAKIFKFNNTRCFGIIVDHKDPSKLWIMVYHITTGLKFSKIQMGNVIS